LIPNNTIHGFEYDPSGRVKLIRANGKNTPVPERFKVHGYPTYEDHGFIWIWWGAELLEDLKPPRFFDDLDDSFSYGRAYDPWDAHYSRVIENQLDVVHLPFVHHDTIGRGGRTLVDEPPGSRLASDLVLSPESSPCLQRSHLAVGLFLHHPITASVCPFSRCSA
jgi:phenylpropionate dioxygenase-like ring-hydroxylating dioxygenase large terminal subunit